jgi:hypothetical protein
MQQINPVGFRVGSVQNWDNDKVLRIRGTADVSWRASLSVKYILARHGCYLLNMYSYNTPSGRSLNTVVVYYRYLQRGRLTRYLSKILRQGDAVLAPAITRLYFNRRILSLRPKSKFLDAAWINMYLNDRLFRGWGDFELLYFAPSNFLYRRSINYKVQSELSRIYSERVFLSTYNVSQFVPIANPVVFSSYYIFRRFSKLRYLHDLVQVVLISAKLGTSQLLGHMLSIGIEKHETKRKQRRFVKMFESVVNRALVWELVQRKPMDWRVSIYGRLDGRIRRSHVLVKVGRTKYQRLDNLMNYSCSVSKSKFSTSSVRVWMRNLVHWK